MPRSREPGAPYYPPLVVRVRRRLAAAHALEACALGFAVGAAAAAVARLGGWAPWPAALAAAGVAAIAAWPWFVRRRALRTAPAAASAIERAMPECRNVVVTAVELAEMPDQARPWIRARVLADAERMLTHRTPGSILPLRLRVAACVVAVVTTALVVFNVHERAAGVLVSTVEHAVQEADGEHRLSVVATLQPPAHTRLPVAALSQPDRITAVEGTRVRIAIRGGGARTRVRFGTLTLPTRADGDASVAELTLRDSGYVAIESGAAAKLIPIAVTPDRAPAIKIERPGRDLLLATAAPSVAVEMSATDDFGLELLALRYTKVSGSGEQFEFVEGELPLAVVREDPRSWRGRGTLALARLGLEPGDSLVYRVVARDGRSGDAGFASSDAFFVEIAGPGQVALEGFEMPPDRERYALSQQMIVLKIQRLRERERSLPGDALQEQTNAIAAEQRAVRANFVFLTGGHVEDEEEEAEQSHEIQEGRLENTARREISRAIGHMSLAEQGLVAVDTAAALKEAKLAVDALQRAFSRNRYLLRTLPVRSRVDPSRRLTGKLDEASGWTRKVPEPPRDFRAQAVRELLAELISIGEDLKAPGKDGLAPRVSRLTELALSTDPADAAWQQISRRLSALRDAIASGESPEAVNGKLREALTPVVAQARRTLASPGPGVVAAGALRGAWAEELRRLPQRTER